MPFRTLIATTALLLTHTVGAQPVYFSLDFPGGNLQSYIDAIRQANPQADIIADNNLSLFTVPATRLTNVDLLASLNLLSGTLVEGPNGTYELQVDSAPIGETDESIMRIRVINLDTRDLDIETRVWSLLSLVGKGVPVPDALAAIEAALSLMQQDTTMRFHEQTHLLIVRGSDEALHLTLSTIEALESDASQMSRQEQEYRELAAQYEYQLIEAQADMTLAQEELRISNELLKLTAQRVNKDVEGPEALYEYQLMVAEKQRDFFVAQKQQELLQQRINELKK